MPLAEFFVSNQVIGESYFALQHHYGIAKDKARAALLDVLTSGLCSPLNGSAVLTALETETGCGLLDRLIADDYASRGIKALTNVRKMARLTEVENPLRSLHLEFRLKTEMLQNITAVQFVKQIKLSPS